MSGTAGYDTVERCAVIAIVAARAGSGDVLCGVVLGLLSQGLKGDEAAVLAAYLHGLAGDKAAETHGEVSLMAGDIAECLCQAFFDFSNFGC